MAGGLIEKSISTVLRYARPSEYTLTLHLSTLGKESCYSDFNAKVESVGSHLHALMCSVSDQIV